MNSIKIYDTTLRDGSQAEGISFTVEDKIRIAQKLDEMGAHYVEGGWPGSNPRDIDFFSKVNRVNFLQTKITAFGSTRYPNKKVEEDSIIQALLRTETEVVTIFGKTWDLHVRDALSTSLDENLRMIFESINYLKKHRTEVLFDAEHFFDGYKNNPEYAIKTIKEAESGGADWIVLCDTNGGSLPDEVHSIFSEVKNSINIKLGIHAHNDSEVAVANSLRAVEAGAQQVQGTINGIGERCGNTNLISIIPNLKIKMGLDCVSNEQLEKLLVMNNKASEGKGFVELSHNVKLTGRWVNEKLRPKIIENPEVVGTNIIVEFLESEGAAVSARAFIWMRRYSEFNLDKRCFPPELFRGIIDARNRAASSTKKKKEAYAFAENDVELLISDLKGKDIKLTRSRGDVYVD